MNSLTLRMIFISFLTLFAIACDEIVWDNPYDANTALDPSDWSPKNLQAQVLSDSQIKLTWLQDDKHIEGFRIERQKDSGSWTQITELATDVTQYIDTGLNFGSSYIYRVYSYTTSTQSGYVTSDTTSTSFPAPTNLTAIVQTDADILLVWTDNCDFEEGFLIERQQNGGTWVQVIEVAANITQYTDAGLSYGVNYTYRVYAYTSSNQSDYAILYNTNTRIASPTNLTAVARNDTEISLEWADNCNFEEGFRIEKQEGGGTWTQVGEVTANITQYTDTELTLGLEYTYRVYAYTSSNQSAFSLSNTITITFPFPSNLTAVAQNDADILLKWTDSCDFEEGFRIERQKDSGTWTQIGEVTADIAQYTDAGLNTLNNFYEYRVYAFTTNNISDYSNSIGLGFVSDTDGNTYQTVKIGAQLWMAENLKVTQYRSGETIPNVTDTTAWGGLTTGAYCFYNNDANNANTYGSLYNWYAFVDSRNIAPEGWHVPDKSEWQTLVDYLGNAGGKMKETGTEHWNAPNSGATNESGFTALPGGFRWGGDSNFSNMGLNALFLSTTEKDNNVVWCLMLDHNFPEAHWEAYFKRTGFSVRCVRD